MNKTAIVTGAGGFLGKKLVEYLISNDYFVIAITRRELCVISQKIENIILDCKDIELLIEKVNIRNIDYFFHLAWEGTSGVKRSDDIVQLKNVENSCKAIRVAAKLGVKKFVNFGSVMEYEAQKISHLNEINTEMIYSFEKFNSHMLTKILAKELNIEYNSACISNIYGPADSSTRFVNKLINCMISNEKIVFSSGRQDYDFIYIDDAIRAILLVAENGVNYEEYYIGTHENKRLKDYIVRIRELINNKYPLVFDDNVKGIFVDYNKLNRGKIYDELGFSLMTSFESGIVDTANSIRKELSK